MKKQNKTTTAIIIGAILVPIVLFLMVYSTISEKKSQLRCDNLVEENIKNQGTFLPYKDRFNNSTAFKPVEICKEEK